MDNEKSKSEKLKKSPTRRIELNESEVGKVTGGRGFIKTVDASSLNLFLLCTQTPLKK
jgi:hypothetical protein